MAKAKAKWLEAENIELLNLANTIVGALGTEEANEKDLKKLPKIISELIERELANTPGDEVEAQLEFAKNQWKKVLTTIEKIGDLAANAAAQVEEEETQIVDEEDSIDDECISSEYSNLTKKELKALAKERGFKVDKTVSKDELVALLSQE